MRRFTSTLIACALALSGSAQVALVTSSALDGATYLDVDDAASHLQFTAAGGEKTVGVTTNLNYAVSTADAAWCTAAKAADGSFTVKAEANTAAAARQATLRLTARDNHSRVFTVSQLGTAPAILVDAAGVTLDDNATDFTLTITSNASVSVTLPDWITTATSETAADGVTTYTFKAATLTEAGTSRTADVVFTDTEGQAASVSVSITQSFKGYPHFAVISDTHFGNSIGEGPMVKVPKALRNILAKTPRVDAIFICGDLTDWGTPSQYVLFKQVFDDTSIVPADLPVYVMMGNHDNYADGALKNYLVLDQPYHRLVDIKGFPFITTSMDGGSWDDYADEEIEALDANLALAAKNYPGKPIFVFTHVPPMNTVYGTCEGEGGWGSNVLTSTLKKYPQVVLFGGHSHFPLADPRSIHQGDFTTINDGSTTYSEVEPGVVNEGIHPDKYGYVTEGCIVDVDKDWNVEIQRWDTYGDEEILPRWTVRAPHDGSQFTYTSARTGGEAPKWTAGSEVKVTNVADEGCTVTFPQATDDENVHHYVIELVQDGKVVATHSKFSGYYLNSRRPDSLSVRMEGIPDGVTLTARVQALDSYKNKSEYLTSTGFTTEKYQPAADAVKPTADLFDVAFGADGAARDVSANGVEVLSGTSTPSTYYNETYNRYVASFAGSSQSFYRIDYNDNTAIKNALSNGFSIEVFYKPADTDNVCPLSAQESGGCGIEQASGGLIQFYCYVGGSYKVLKSSVTAKAGQYYHVVAVYDKQAAKTRIYVNGSPAGEMDASGSFGFPSNTDARWFGIGGDAHGGNYAQYCLEGEVAVARMYGSALSRDEAFLLYQDLKESKYTPSPDAVKPTADLFDITFKEDGTAADASAHAVTVSTGSSAPTTSYNETYGRTMATFAGSGSCYYRVDYADDEAIRSAFTNGFSFECLYMTNNTSNVCPLSAQESGGAGIEQASGGQLQFYCRVGGSYKVVKSSVTVETGRYYHVVAVYDKANSRVRMYVDGEPVGELAAEGTFGFPSDADAQWIGIGADAHAGYGQFGLDGNIVLARMYGHALTRDEAYLLFQDVKTE